MRKLIIVLLVTVVFACAGIAYGVEDIRPNHNMTTDYVNSWNYDLFQHEYHIGSIKVNEDLSTKILGSYSNARIKTSSYIAANVIMTVVGDDGRSVTKTENPQARVYNGGSGRTNTLYANYMYGYMDVRGGTSSTGGEVYMCELGVKP